MLILASLCNGAFVMLWKKTMAMYTPALFAMFVRLLFLIGGAVYYLSRPEGLLYNQNYQSTNGFTPVSGFSQTLQYLLPLIICGVIVSFFYIFNSNIYMAVEVSRVYPLIASGTTLAITLAGIIIFSKSITLNKVIGVLAGVVAIWLLTRK